MLDYRILELDYGVSYGSETLKSLQNDSIPEIDLLVREAIQNSSDAALKEEGDSFDINFQIGTFSPRKLNQYLTAAESILNRRFPEELARFMEIRDTKTSGLTGSIKKAEIKDDDHGNFFKLIYDSGKRQTQEHAGGNWGHGKSVYYRVGAAGIVIYYSQIKVKNGFETRLILTLVENEEDKERSVLREINPKSAGKAWWGIDSADKEDLLPLGNNESDIIKGVLDVFGIAPFKSGETGTSIIIPYINCDKLLGDVIPAESEIEEAVRQHFTTVWLSDLKDYLRLSIQRWYAPKIHNRELTTLTGQKWLRVSVNNVPISKTKLLPFFNAVQELYTLALAKTVGKEYSSDLLTEAECFPVNVKNHFDGSMTAGYVSVVKIDRDTLNQGQNVLDPYDYIGRFEADGGINEPIVMYARDPGMVIEYPIAGPWVKNIIPSESQEEFVFAFFVPDTSKKLKDDLSVPEYAGMTLGEYLRSCESSDHMGWNDPARMQIVTRIQKNTINAINGKLKKAEPAKTDATASKLSNRLGKKLLPRKGYGKKHAGGGGSGGSGGGGSIANAVFSVKNIERSGNRMELLFTLQLMHAKKEASISLIIDSEGGKIDPASWQDDIGTKYPVSIEDVEILAVSTSLSPEPVSIKKKCSTTEPSIRCDQADFEIRKADGSNEYSAFLVKSHIMQPTFVGLMHIAASDKKYDYTFGLE